MARLYFPAILSSSQSSNPETIASYEESAIPRNNEPDGFRERRRGSKRSTKPIYFLFQQRKIPGSSGDNGKERNRVTKNPDKGSLLRERHLENTGNRRYFREYHRRSYQKRSQINRPKNRFSPFSLSPINSRSNSFFSLLGDDSGSTRKIPFYFIYTRNGMQFAVSGIFFLITISLQLSVGCLRENNRINIFLDQFV